MSRKRKSITTLERNIEFEEKTYRVNYSLISGVATVNSIVGNGLYLLVIFSTMSGPSGEVMIDILAREALKGAKERGKL